MIDRNTIIGFDAKRIVSNNTGLGSYSRTLVNDLAAATEARLLLFAPTSGNTELRRQIAVRDSEQHPDHIHCKPPITLVVQTDYVSTWLT